MTTGEATTDAHSHTGEARAQAVCWAAAAAALLLAGPAVGLIARFDTTPSGAPHATVFTAASPFLAAIAVFGATVLVIALGLGFRTLLTRRYAIFASGLVFAWLAFAQGRLETLARDIEPGSVLARLSLDGVLMLLLAAPAAWLILQPSGRDGAIVHHRHTEPEPEGFFAGQSLLGLAIALAGAIVGAFLFAQSPMRGQTLAAGLAAGVVAGLATRLLTPTAARLAPVLGVLLAGVVAPLLTLLTLPENADVAVLVGSVFPPGRLAPADWALGAFTGVAAGQYFALSMVDHPNTKK